jgi:hypothetical protein
MKQLKKLFLGTLIASLALFVFAGCDAAIDALGGGEVDKTELRAAISDATTTIAGVKISANGEDIPASEEWVTSAVVDVLKKVVADAEKIANDVSATKTQVIINRKSKEILDVREAKGSVHDFKVFKETIGRAIDPSILIHADLGYLGIEKLHENSRIPLKDGCTGNGSDQFCI